LRDFSGHLVCAEIAGSVEGRSICDLDAHSSARLRSRARRM
jgi:hypothetical protein